MSTSLHQLTPNSLDSCWPQKAAQPTRDGPEVPDSPFHIRPNLYIKLEMDILTGVNTFWWHVVNAGK